MKRSKAYLQGSCILLASFVLFSCKKQLTEPAAEAAASSVTVQSIMAPTTCKPALFGSHGTFANNWTTIEQQWYSGDQLSNLQVRLGATGNGFPVAPFFVPLFVDWSVITYQGNQVVMTQHPQNHQLMRVVLNASGLPEAYYYHQRQSATEYYKDTAYLYYTGTRLDSIVSLVEFQLFVGFTQRRSAKYKFSYDTYGNLTEVDMPELAPIPARDGSKVTFGYDLTKPVSGIMVNHNISISFRLLTSMGLLKLPMHFALSDYKYVSYTNNVTTDVHVDNHYTEYNISPEGLVNSYVLQTASNRITYYNAWECGGPATRNAAPQKKESINTLEQFRKAFPVQ